MNAAPDALRLALGTLTIYPTPPPARVDSVVAGWAMALAPAVAVLLALPLYAVSDLAEHRWSAFVLATIWVAGLAGLTRSMHLDALADTADGLGSRKPPEAALGIMRQSDIGPFGVATIVLVLLLQIAGASQLLSLHDGPAYLAAAVVASRLTLPLLCARGVPSARVDGLGSTVAGSVGPPQLATAVAITMLAVLVLSLGVDIATPLALALVGPGVGLAFGWWCVRRLGGITGDVLGACVEVALTAALLTMSLA